MSPNESAPLTEADLEAQTAEISEETQTVADDILVEVKECQTQLKEQTAAFRHLQENGATRAQLEQAVLELKNTRQEMTELMQEFRQTLRQQQPPTNSPENPNPSGESQPLTPSAQAPLGTINPEKDGAENQERTTPKKKRRIL